MRSEVRLQIRSSMLEKLINQALAQGAVLQQIRRSGRRTILVDCSEASGEILLNLCKRYRIDCKTLHRHGKSVLRAWLRRRATLCAGVLLCIALCTAVLSRIWIIDVEFPTSGAALGDERLLRAQLEEMGVHTGLRTSALDTDVLQKQLSAQAENYSHVNIRRQGVRLLIEAAPEAPAPELYSLANARDLVAAMDGIVTEVNVKSGHACVKPGDTVRKGQLLIRGEEDQSAEETIAVSALGEICVRAWFEGRSQAPLIENRLLRTGRTSDSKRLRLLRWSLPLREAEDFFQYETQTCVQPIVGLFLPLELIQERRYETETVAVEAEQSALKAQLLTIAQAQAKAEMSLHGPQDFETTDYWEDCTVSDGIMQVRAVYEITANVAVSRDAIMEEVNQTWKAADK